MNLGNRIMIMGSPGSGKSTLAKYIGNKCNLPVVHVDCLFWKPGWITSAQEEIDQKIETIAASERWVIDGNYHRTFGTREQRATTLIYIDFSRYLCLWRIFMRTIKNYGKNRDDLVAFLCVFIKQVRLNRYHDRQC